MCCYLLTRSGTPYYQPLRRCEQISSILMARSAHHAAILRLDLGFALSTIEKMQAEIEYLTGDGGHAAARNFWCVQLIIYKENEESKPWVSVSMQPSENRNAVAVHARNKQNQDNLKNYNLAPIRTDLPPPARRSPPLQRRPSRRPRTLPTSRLVPSPWRNTPRGCRKTGCSTYLKRSDENVNARAIDPVGSLRISGDRYRMCDTRANIRTSFPKTAASRDLLGC
jgi:hypothetical protein